MQEVYTYAFSDHSFIMCGVHILCKIILPCGITKKAEETKAEMQRGSQFQRKGKKSGIFSKEILLTLLLLFHPPFGRVSKTGRREEVYFVNEGKILLFYES